MPTYTIACLRRVDMGPPIVEYLQRIDGTLTPYEGRFKIHGGPYERLEGDWNSNVVIIEFPDRQRARDWYFSAAYQAILPLRTGNAEGEIILIDTVTDHHRATDILAGPS